MEAVVDSESVAVVNGENDTDGDVDTVDDTESIGVLERKGVIDANKLSEVKADSETDKEVEAVVDSVIVPIFNDENDTEGDVDTIGVVDEDIEQEGDIVATILLVSVNIVNAD